MRFGFPDLPKCKMDTLLILSSHLVCLVSLSGNSIGAHCHKLKSIQKKRFKDYFNYNPKKCRPILNP